MGFVYLLTAITVASAWFCFVTARKKGLNKVYWTTVGALFGPFAIPFVLMAKETSSTQDPQ